MTKTILAAVIVLSFFTLASSYNAADLSNNESNTTLLNGTENATNSTNSTLNTTNSTMNLTAANLTNESDLWSWGNAPAGYAKATDGGLVSVVSLDAEGSVMETPSQALSNDDDGDQPRGLLVRPN